MSAIQYWMLAGLGFVYGWLGYGPTKNGPLASARAGCILSGVAIALLGAVIAALLRYAWLELWLALSQTNNAAPSLERRGNAPGDSLRETAAP